MSARVFGRRAPLGRIGEILVEAFGRSQSGPARVRRLPPREELINVFEYEEVARSLLQPTAHATIAGGDRTAFDTMTLRPRMCIPTLDLDLTVELFGDQHYTPIIAGPAGDQRRFHTDGELATVRGASAAQAGIIISSRSSVPVGRLAGEAKTPLWYSVYAADRTAARTQAQQARDAGAKVLCVTLGAAGEGAKAASLTKADWAALDQIVQGLNLPIVVKGVMTTRDAELAISAGARGIIVSNHGSTQAGGAPIEVLPSIVDAVGLKVPVLVDGSFRRGHDIVKALILGARGVLVTRPVMWGLAAYGAAGVQSVLEMLQSDLARQMGAIGVSTLSGLNRNYIKIHGRTSVTSAPADN
jgi:4-hydroxymandelate oxidase